MKTRHLWGLLGLIVLARITTLGLYPLTDTTEARYAEMARKMLESGNWLTPMFDVGVPFWGKPPLSFWLSALPMALGGVSEFTARLGPLIAAGFVVALFWAWSPAPLSKNRANNRLALCASVVFLSTPLGFIASAAVMTDMAMTAGTDLSMLAFWRAWTAPSGRSAWRCGWGWLFFVGQAIGLMAKGPVAVVLTGVALGLFVMLEWRRSGLIRTLTQVWRYLPWLGGLALTAALVLPWYALAEQATPGFLSYFLLGEHWARFTQSGWKGDLYGVAHAQPKGRIWLFALLCTLPWVLWAVVSKLRSSSVISSIVSPLPAAERDYLLAWMLSTPLFFTLSGNILPAYVLPSLPAFALWVAWLWQRQPALSTRIDAAGALMVPLVVPLAWVALVLFKPTLFADYAEQASLQRAEGPVAYFSERPASAVFYGHGRTRLITDQAELEREIQAKKVTLALPLPQLNAWQPLLAGHGWREVARSKGFMMFAVLAD